jgi:hypothetical protein
LSDDLLVVGLDLETGHEVCLTEPTVEYWRERDYMGRRTLVCALCHAGLEAEPGTCVPLVVRAKFHGLRRPHFAHPPGQAPVGGHHPESVWHLSAKAVLAAWAHGQQGVADVAVERWTPDRARRSDVRVSFGNGHQIALEAQATVMTDREWLARHADYQRQNVTDVWLWRRGIRPHWVAVHHGQSLWELDPVHERAYLLLGAAHDRPTCWWAAQKLHLYAQHEPPCVGDILLRRELPLSTIGLTAHGLVIPESIHQEISEAHTSVREAANRGRPARTARTPPRPRPVPPVKPRQLTCQVCGLPLDPVLATIGRHVLC